MNLGTVKNLQLLPGINSSNSIAVVRKGTATDLSGEIRKLGAVFRISNDNSEGFHHSVRTLVELGAIEIVGRLTQIPYWECLDIESTNPAVQAQVQDWYTGLEDNERLLFAQSKLSPLGFYRGPVDGVDSADLRSAIAQYKADQGLIADGDINFSLYYKLIIDKTPVAPQHIALLRRANNEGLVASAYNNVASRVGIETPGQNVSEPLPGVPGGLGGSAIKPLELKLSTDRGMDRVSYREGENVVARVELSADAHVFCFYQQGDGGVLKIFPNRFQQQSRLEADQPLDIPGNGKFSIRADKAGQSERIMCLASYQDIDKSLPFQLRENDLERLPVKDLDQVYGYYRSVAKTLPFRKFVDIAVTD
jgi:peptidoglycan hydrolase-like protein with peptidoglycan-binding domain